MVMQVEESQREAQRIKTNREELVFRIAKALPEDGVLDASAGFRLARASKLTEAVPSIFEPSLCIVAQGSKQVLLGDEVYRYDPGHYLIYTVDLPLTFHVKIFPN